MEESLWRAIWQYAVNLKLCVPMTQQFYFEMCILEQCFSNFPWAFFFFFWYFIMLGMDIL